MLYAFLMKNHSIPIKFIIDYVGPVTLELKLWIKLKNENEPLNNITFADIENATNEGKIDYL